MRKRVWIAAVAAVLGAALLTFCLGKDSEKIHRASQEPVDISFSWWGNDGRNEYTMEGVRLFEENHMSEEGRPLIDVSCRFGVWNGFPHREQMAMESKTNADVMQVNYAWLAQYSSDGTGYYDLNRSKDVIDFSNYSDDDLAFGTRNGKLNAIPIAYNADTAIYNQDVYRSFGLELPKTWDDLFAAAKVMSPKGIFPMSAVKKHMWLMMVAWYEQTYGHPAFSEDGTCKMQQSEVEAMLSFYKRLIDEKVCPPVDEADTDFFNQTAAGILCWISDTDRYGDDLIEKGADIEPGTLYTNGTSGTGWYMKPATMYAISSTTRHPAEAATLLNYLVSDEQMVLLQGTEKGIPINRKAFETLESHDKLMGITEKAQQVFENERETLSAMPNILENDDVIGAFKSAGDKYIYGEDTLPSCAAEVLKAARDAGND